MRSHAELAAERAKLAAFTLRKELNLGDAPVEMGVVLGTGWGNALEWEGGRSISFSRIPGFGEIQTLAGHEREVVAGKIGGKLVVALRGRLHLNEHPSDPNLPLMVRLQAEMLMYLGVKRLILTCAAGSLRPTIKMGDIMVLDGLIDVLVPMPGFAGEFCSPEDTLDAEFRNVADEIIDRETGSPCPHGGYVIVRGPNFEGRKYAKEFLRCTGASAVGMSMAPEAFVAALYGAKVLGLSFITNSDSEDHSHAENQRRAAERAGMMGAVLTKIIERIG